MPLQRGTPGAIGVGLYLVWPAFYTDVTDSYRFGRAGRLRTDLGGMYFNAIFALALASAYSVTGFEPLLVAVVAQQVLIVDQFVPWMRLDGYYVISDLIGVADLFLRIKPVLASLLPRRERDPRVKELKRWARMAVRIWVFATVAMLATGLVGVLFHAPPYLEQAWTSLLLRIDALQQALGAHHVALAVREALSAFFLVLPALGVLLTYLMLCRMGGQALAIWRSRASIASVRAQAREAALRDA